MLIYLPDYFMGNSLYIIVLILPKERSDHCYMSVGEFKEHNINEENKNKITEGRQWWFQCTK